MSDLPPLNRLHRAQELYEKDINTPQARHNIPILFLLRVSDELSEQAAIIRDLRAEVTTLEAKVEEVFALWNESLKRLGA